MSTAITTDTSTTTDRLTAIAAAAIAAHPTAHHIKVRVAFGAYSAALLSFGEHISPAELAWENDLLVSGRLAGYHDEEVTKLLGLASDRLDAVLDREISTGRPVVVSVKIGDLWVDVGE